ncbi:MAG: hypothetical protein ACREPB_03505 [Arenimonas sp.]
MECIEADKIRHTNWDRVFFNEKQAVEPPKIGWNMLVFIAVAFLHVAVVGYWFQWREAARPSMDILQEALEVIFIEQPTVFESVAVPSHSIENTRVKKSRTAASRDIVDVPLQLENNDDVSPASLRLSLGNDEWNASPAIMENDPLKRQHIALAGRAEPFIKGIKLRNKLTPQQKLAMVGKLFGALEYDPCAEARRRLASGQSQLNEIDLEADLRSIENHCRP